MATGNTSGCLREESLRSDTSCAMGGSEESEYVTATASGGDHATTSSSFHSAEEEQMEKSKSHWSTLADQSGSMEEGEEREAEVSNVHEFQALQSHPVWGHFFCTFGYDTEWKRMGEMEVGAKFAEGGQAELFHALVTWWYPPKNEEDRRDGTEYVLKVFKKGIIATTHPLP